MRRLSISEEHMMGIPHNGGLSLVKAKKRLEHALWNGHSTGVT